ncbi:MAG TPA: four helix bundle protein, partial [Phycisphaerae bacterium]|nr:four helix bundle protein [Phycisphaerae bacterium]
VEGDRRMSARLVAGLGQLLTCGHLFSWSPAQFVSRGPSMAFMFEKLDVYQKSVDFVDDVAALIEGFLRGYGFLVNQLNRAALSI